MTTTAPAAYREGGMRHRLLSLALRLAGPKAPLPETTSSAAPGVHGKDEDIPPIKAAASILPIILEAEKRGITVRLKGPTSYSLSLAGKTFDCVKSLTPLASPAAVELCNDRDKTFEFLTSIHIPVPSYIVFAPDNPNAAIKFMNDNTSVVVKPSKDSSGGKGVSVDVSTEPGLKRAIAYTQDEIRKNSSDADVRIEKFYKGTDYRLLVIDSKLVAAGELTPASVVGDGASTIEMLIQEREKSGKPILNDDEAKRCLEMQKLSYDSIPEKGMTVQVRNNANTATGGSMKDVTKELPQYLRDVAEHIAKELFAKESNLPVLGIDVRVEAPGKYVVIELSADPTLSTLNRYQPDVVPRYIDTMFPNTAEDHPEALPQ